MSGIPEWLEPYLRQGAYNPTQEDISNLEPQSRQEMILKFASLTEASELSNYYNKQEVDNLISTIPKFAIEVVSQLPTRDISETTVYLVPSQSEEDDFYKEYIYVNNDWELLGIQKVDLNNYYDKSEINSLLSNKVSNSTLTNDYWNKLPINNTNNRSDGGSATNPTYFFTQKLISNI